MFVEGVGVLCIVLLGIAMTIPIILVTVYSMIFFFEAGIAAMTNVAVLCSTMNTTVTNFTCPTPWHYASYVEAVVACKHIASVLFWGTIAFFVLMIVCGGLGACFNGKRSEYSSV